MWSKQVSYQILLKPSKITSKKHQTEKFANKPTVIRLPNGKKTVHDSINIPQSQTENTKIPTRERSFQVQQLETQLKTVRQVQVSRTRSLVHNEAVLQLHRELIQCSEGVEVEVQLKTEQYQSDCEFDGNQISQQTQFYLQLQSQVQTQFQLHSYSKTQEDHVYIQPLEVQPQPNLQPQSPLHPLPLRPLVEVQPQRYLPKLEEQTLIETQPLRPDIIPVPFTSENPFSKSVRVERERQHQQIGIKKLLHEMDCLPLRFNDSFTWPGS